MSRVAKLISAVLGFVVVVVLAVVWWFVDGSTTWPRTLHCRRTVVVDTPQGQRSGSNVVEYKTYFPGGLITRAQGYGVIGRGQGEATVVDLGARGLLFATLANEEELASGGLSFYAACETPFPRQKFLNEFERRGSANDVYADYLDELNRQRPEGEVPFKYLPMLVRFRDLRDPASVERVVPSDVAASFGAGVKLVRMTIEITDAPVTKGIEAVLPWLVGRESQRLRPPPPGPLSDTPLVSLLTDNDFRRFPK
jgi:hypothetical protein